MNHQRHWVGSTIAAISLAVLMSSTSAEAATHRSNARLRGSPSIDGQVKYQERMVNGTREKKLTLLVQNANPNQLMRVRVNGRKVAQIRTSSAGSINRQLTFTSGMPVIRSGDVVEVGPVGGVCYEDGDIAEFGLEGIASDAGASYSAQYHESMDDGTLEREFEVEVEDAAADATLDVVVDGVLVGQVVTDSFGQANIEFHTLDIDNDGEDDDDGSLPFPENFPTINEGSVVEIGGVAISLTPISGCDNDD